VVAIRINPGSAWSIFRKKTAWQQTVDKPQWCDFCSVYPSIYFIKKSMDMNYKKLVLTLIISFIIMYAVMFLNVDDAGHIYLSTTRLYMAILMVAPMAILMLITMGKMYPNKRVNVAIMALSAGAFIAALIFLRNQTFISDRAYMKAMIPHHSSAILTSKHATIKDPEVRQLADQIIRSQQEEIAQMKKILARLDNQ
jgi:hypothetical protein